MKRTRSEEERDVWDLTCQIHEFQIGQISPVESLREKYKLSDSFYHKMEALMRKQEKKAKRRKRMRGLVVAAAVFLIAMLILRPQYFVEADDKIIRWFSDHISFQFQEDADTSWIPRYEMTYVPNGYDLYESNYYEGMGGLDVYINQDGKHLYFEYGLIDSALNIDREEKEYLKMKSNKGENFYYLKAYDEEGESSLTWASQDGTVKFNVSGTLTEEELLAIQESIRIKSL